MKNKLTVQLLYSASWTSKQEHFFFDRVCCAGSVIWACIYWCSGRFLFMCTVSKWCGLFFPQPISHKDKQVTKFLGIRLRKLILCFWKTNASVQNYFRQTKMRIYETQNNTTEFVIIRHVQYIKGKISTKVTSFRGTSEVIW